MCNRSIAKRFDVSHPSPRRGFTLVELLVVIGIIALLISILLPTLNKANMAAKQTACLSQLKQIGTAFAIHAHEHDGYIQIAGVINPLIPATPDGLGDSRMRRYSYYTDNGVQRPMPIAASLSPYLGRRVRDDSAANLGADQTAPDSVLRRMFTCPGEVNPMLGVSLRSNYGGVKFINPSMYSSYAFNETLLNWKTFTYNGVNLEALRGHMTAFRQPSRTVLACDQFVQGGNPAVLSYFLLSASTKGATMGQAWFGQNTALPDKKSFDPIRHRGRMNWLAADMHAESALLPGVNDTYRADGPMSDIFIVAP